MTERLTGSEILTINKPFNPFTADELRILEGEERMVKKWFKIDGVMGDLHIDVCKDIDVTDSAILDSISPWEEEPLDEDWMSPNNPYYLGMCFNNNGGSTPTFRLSFPGAINPTFLGIVGDWDVVRDSHDAIQDIFRGYDRDNPVDLYLPRDLSKIATMEVTATNEIITFPNTSV